MIVGLILKRTGLDFFSFVKEQLKQIDELIPGLADDATRCDFQSLLKLLIGDDGLS